MEYGLGVDEREGMKNNSKKQNIGISLLRIVATYFVVARHASQSGMGGGKRLLI